LVAELESTSSPNYLPINGILRATVQRIPRKRSYQIATFALDFTIEVAATEARGPGSPAERLARLVRVLTIWHTCNSQVAHVVQRCAGTVRPSDDLGRRPTDT
jgi:hypothetical protein